MIERVFVFSPAVLKSRCNAGFRFAETPRCFDYIHSENYAGLGASHQTGWTALVAKLLQQSGGEDPYFFLLGPPQIG
jgi:hypothetical protein